MGAVVTSTFYWIVVLGAAVLGFLARQMIPESWSRIAMLVAAGATIMFFILSPKAGTDWIVPVVLLVTLPSFVTAGAGAVLGRMIRGEKA